MAKLSREAMKLYMRDYRRGIRRRLPPVLPTPPEVVQQIKDYLLSAHRLRAIGVRSKA